MKYTDNTLKHNKTLNLVNFSETSPSRCWGNSSLQHRACPKEQATECCLAPPLTERRKCRSCLLSSRPLLRSSSIFSHKTSPQHSSLFMIYSNIVTLPPEPRRLEPVLQTSRIIFPPGFHPPHSQCYDHCVDTRDFNDPNQCRFWRTPGFEKNGKHVAYFFPYYLRVSHGECNPKLGCIYRRAFVVEWREKGTEPPLRRRDIYFESPLTCPYFIPETFIRK